MKKYFFKKFIGPGINIIFMVETVVRRLNGSRREQRIRRYLTLGSDPHSQIGRNDIMERFAFNVQAAQEAARRQSLSACPPGRFFGKSLK
jgi:hypothetical protein